MDNMSIYQKIAILQDQIKVNKDNKNTFADFEYRTIQDILSELKPLLKELNLILYFGSGKLDNNNVDKYMLEMHIIDINDTKSCFTETGEIYIDRSKSKMDLSQKCTSAKTFLKKSLLEDLLLINENEDPDGHDNTGKSNSGNSSSGKSNKGKPVENEAGKRQYLKSILYEAGNKNKDRALELLKKETTFTKKDGSVVEGVEDFDKLKGARLEISYNKIIKLYPEIFKDLTEKAKAKQKKGS